MNTIPTGITLVGIARSVNGLYSYPFGSLW